MSMHGTKTKPLWIHEPGDGRGARMVFVAGVLQERVLYADERRGFARIACKDNPQRHEIVRGHVTVLPHP